MIGAQLSITPTEAAAHARRRAFRQRIAAMAVPDSGICLKPLPIAPAPEPEPVVEAPKPKRNVSFRTWFRVVEDIGPAVSAAPTVSEIQEVVADYFKLKRADLIGKRRTREVVRPRQIAIYLSKVITQRSLPEIGRRFGYRDHSTALHSVRKIAKLCKEDLGIAYDVAHLEACFP